MHRCLAMYVVVTTCLCLLQMGTYDLQGPDDDLVESDEWSEVTTSDEDVPYDNGASPVRKLLLEGPSEKKAVPPSKQRRVVMLGRLVGQVLQRVWRKWILMRVHL
jgi:hypothetical protein